jgi:hypothetical protein
VVILLSQSPSGEQPMFKSIWKARYKSLTNDVDIGLQFYAENLTSAMDEALRLAKSYHLVLYKLEQIYIGQSAET